MLKPTPRVDQSVEKDARKLTLRSLFELEETNLLRYAFSLIGRRAVAEEIVQEVFLQLHIRWDDVNSPREWLFRSVRNRAYNYMRDNRRVTLNNIDDDKMQSDNDEEESPEELLLRLEAIGELRQMVEQLGEDDRRLVKLKYFEDLKYCLLYTSPSPRDLSTSRMPSSA